MFPGQIRCSKIAYFSFGLRETISQLLIILILTFELHLFLYYPSRAKVTFTEWNVSVESMLLILYDTVEIS